MGRGGGAGGLVSLQNAFLTSETVTYTDLFNKDVAYGRPEEEKCEEIKKLFSLLLNQHLFFFTTSCQIKDWCKVCLRLILIAKTALFLTL